MVLRIVSMLEAISPFEQRAVGMHRGSFANSSYPSNVVAMQVSYTPNSVVARVREFAVPELVPLLPGLSTSSRHFVVNLSIVLPCSAVAR